MEEDEVNVDIEEVEYNRENYYQFAYIDHPMGKCVSKQQPGGLGNFGGTSTSYIAISERSDELSLNEGQSESKRNAKRGGTSVSETKGTAMSFGFKKKFSGTSNKKNGNNINNKEKEKEKEKLEREEKYRISSATVISNPGINRTDNILSDNNGNTGSMDSLNENEISGRSTPRLLPPKKDSSGVPYRQNRFGFRQANTVRPASAGLTPKIAENDCVINNNVPDKPRSKSASGMTNSSRYPIGTSIQQQNRQTQQQPNPKINTAPFYNQQQQQQQQLQQQQQHHQQQQMQQQQLKLQQQHYDRQKFYSEMQSCAMSNQYINNTNGSQYTVVNTGIHTNSIVKPIPKPPDSVSKFTLHTTSLPKPQYPVPISLPPRNVMDTKVAKQALNSSRRGFQGPRDISSDSGIASFDSYADRMDGSPRKSKNRPRNLEMIMSGRNCFAVRDLDDSLSDDTIVPLVLPKLPSAFNSSTQTAPLNGLVRADMEDSLYELRKSSIGSSDIGSIEEEKAYRDKSTSEKSLKMAALNEYSSNSKNSSPASSRASWGNAGDTMAMKECSSLSFSSSDESKADTKVQQDSYEEDLSSVTITTGQPFSSITLSAPSFNKNYENAVTTKNVFLTIEDSKFAQMAAAASDILLDDETSPTDSLVSSCTDTDELISKKNKKKINDSIKEKEIDDISPEIDLTSPLSPGTPTHASNSFSLSDGGRDFLIDDEIADQPALVFDDGNDMPNTSELGNSSLHLQSITDTPTLMETGSMRSSSLPPKPKSKMLTTSSPMKSGSFMQQSKQKNSLLRRTESLDTLSPCESIASDDLMMDFECHSSMDSIDRVPRSNGSGSGSALHSMDETQLWSELEAKGGDIAREWSSLLRSQRQNSRESITSQLPARATRLLNRSRLQQTPSVGGSDSPRSLDSIPRRTPLGKTNIFKDQTSPEDMVIVDKSLRNSMLQDVVHFKKQLVRLRRLLQEDEEGLMRTETLNPFEHGQFFASCGIDLKQGTIDERDSGSQTPSLSDDPRQELADLRRQVVFLQSQMDDKDRTIRMQQNVIAKLEEEHEKKQIVSVVGNNHTDTVSTATQTERLRPISMGQEGISRSEQQIRNLANNNGVTTSPLLKRQNQILSSSPSPSSSSSSSTLTSPSQSPPSIVKSLSTNLLIKKNSSKTVRTTQVGNVITSKKSDKNPLAIENGINTNYNINNINNNNNNININNINGGIVKSSNSAILNGITLTRKIHNNNNNNIHNNLNNNLLTTTITPPSSIISKKIPTLVKTQYNNKKIKQDGKIRNLSSYTNALNTSNTNLHIA